MFCVKLRKKHTVAILRASHHVARPILAALNVLCIDISYSLKPISVRFTKAYYECFQLLDCKVLLMHDLELSAV